MKAYYYIPYSLNSRKLIFFVYPDPRGDKENQYAPFGDGADKLIFEAMSSGNQIKNNIEEISINQIFNN